MRHDDDVHLVQGRRDFGVDIQAFRAAVLQHLAAEKRPSKKRHKSHHWKGRCEVKAERRNFGQGGKHLVSFFLRRAGSG